MSNTYEKILVSGCFLGEKVRYDGKISPLVHDLLLLWQKQNRLISLCPEVFGGLSIPREPAEIQQKTGEVITISGINVSVQFNKGAQQALQLCNQYNIRYALLKESSPSCGSNNIHDGSFSNNKIKGQGKTTQLLQQNGIRVFSENTIDTLAMLIAKQNDLLR